ncbi:methyl-accepting chemotaxis protein [Rhodospirillum rubrum]|uniref:Methyl-accepting chemotaxis sensory transducer n=2 Tax=Rhodospirillum rubrum TaxID=1085 RepID=Q2RU41_RHORT|nr:methyl-accepting chemotaxis protein [Rhodospirillum rubrum]ABC22354.1 methyl-accepting chemotaxis sensory transducer [Rhodospirillum rubrum ATCC 11170]AEO48070.1 methyl-accepting chemotaxis sensory transducer [Rhodospirillum rubrum F11]MBK5953934.1 methyl-accepting chemotaxis protein [Rhodospirillum rubrum]QXG81993.1 methyl-accepting chemotaxis protein [Rhodospirillum rubrum]HAQ01243.1 methyl-accepting chemotaxis protein [Rhodospirillum rubrum]
MRIFRVAIAQPSPETPVQPACPPLGDSGAPGAAGPTSETLTALINDVLHRVETLSIDLADVAGDIDTIARFVKRQEELFSHLVVLAQDVQGAIDRIDNAGQSTNAVTKDASDSMRRSGEAIRAAIENIEGLTRAVSGIAGRLSTVEQSLDGVNQSSAIIRTVAQQTNLLALNATIEAAHAGDAGRGFAIVAKEVKTLAGQSQGAATGIQKTVNSLSSSLGELIETSGTIVANAQEANNGIAVINEAVSGFSGSISIVDRHVDEIAGATATTKDRCADIVREIHQAAEGVSATSRNLASADQRVSSIVSVGEALIATILESGVETPDTPFIAAVRDAAEQVAAALEGAIDRGQISLAALFSEVYTPIPGSDPAQVTTAFTDLVDRLFPPIQEPLLTLNEKVVFCAAVDRNGYLPTHNQKFSKPQGPDPVWNNANSRNRRIFNDRTGLAAGRNTRPFLVQTYRRDMGGGSFIMMKDASAPIFVKGRHWGGFRMGYRL